MPACVECVTRHVMESASCSGTLCGVRVVPRPKYSGGAPAVTPGTVMCAAHSAGGSVTPACSTPRGARRTVCRTRTPSRWNMPEALVGVTVRQPCCFVRESRYVNSRAHQRREAMFPQCFKRPGGGTSHALRQWGGGTSHALKQWGGGTSHALKQWGGGTSHALKQWGSTPRPVRMV
jgi:hypothetical protein